MKNQNAELSPVEDFNGNADFTPSKISTGERGGSTPPHPPSSILHPPSGTRVLKATVPEMEFGAVQWAAKRCIVTHPNGLRGPMTLETFLRLAVLAKLREVVASEIKRGKRVPAEIAALIQH